jgi:prepilin-type N-terminal cleavage/methylation domain-containing protein
MCTSSDRRAPGARSGFTLLEVVLALALLALLVSAIYAIVQGAMGATITVTREENRNREVEGYIDLLRRSLRTLPGEGTITYEIVELLGKKIPKLTVDGGSFIFPGGSLAGMYSAMILTAREQVGGLWTLGLERELTDEEKKERTSLEDDPRAFLPLVSDVTTFQWRFYDTRTQQWREEWTERSTRPGAIELNIVLAGEQAPIRSLCWMPPIAARGRGAPRAPDENNPPSN